jgi:transcription elongation factor Elf1
MKRNVTERRFKCPKCGFITVAYKRSNHRTKQGHQKNLYCPFCKDTHNFTQLSKYE